MRAALLSVALALTACGGVTRSLNRTAADDRSIVAIYIDLEDSPSWDQVWLRCRGLDGREVGWFMLEENGIFYRDDVPLGTCWVLHGFHSGYRRGDYFELGNDPATNVTAIRIARPGAHVIGAFKFVKGATRSSWQGEFSLLRTTTPTDRDILGRLLAPTEGTGWNGVIRRRLDAAR